MLVHRLQPLLGAGSEARYHGLHLVQVWGLAPFDTPLPIDSISSESLSILTAAVPKSLFSTDHRVILEEQSLLRHQFNSLTMGHQLPLFSLAVKHLKSCFREILRQNMRHAMLYTARNCLTSSGYIPQTQLRSASDLVLDLTRSCPPTSLLLSQWCVWWTTIRATHIYDLHRVSNKNHLSTLSNLCMDAMGISYRINDRSLKGCFRIEATRIYHDQLSWLHVFKKNMLVSFLCLLFCSICNLSSFSAHSTVLFPIIPSRLKLHPRLLYPPWSNPFSLLV